MHHLFHVRMTGPFNVFQMLMNAKQRMEDVTMTVSTLQAASTVSATFLDMNLKLMEGHVLVSSINTVVNEQYVLSQDYAIETDPDLFIRTRQQNCHLLNKAHSI